jgi:hypothetical protein
MIRMGTGDKGYKVARLQGCGSSNLTAPRPSMS